MKTQKNYNPSEIERKWQKRWEEGKIYSPNLDKAQKPFYNLMMFPYPSAEGMHVGNMYAFTGADVYGRFQRMQGLSVFEPIGLDGFGIHSENYAIKVGNHPVEQAKISEKNYYKQLKSIGNGFDWTRTVETYDTSYYKWTQWLFIQLFKAGLAYRKKAPVNFCPSCKTVLADEQVLDGVCERCESEVVKKELEQWFFKITKYANRLLANIPKLDWSEKVKIAQREWIGKSDGAKIKFSLVNIPGQEDKKHSVDVFTTRLDTIFGATFLTVSPKLAKTWLVVGWKAKDEVKEYIEKSLKDRTAQDLQKEKTGVFSGIHAINPVNNEKIPVWIADYVLSGYGTGAIMAVPAHDERDHQFAIKHKLPIRKVIDPHNEFKSLILKKSIMNESAFVKELQANYIGGKEYYDWGVIIQARDNQQEKYIGIIQKHLKEGPWYADADGSLKAVIFKDKIFSLPKEKNDAKEYGRKIGIPEEQLDWQTERNYAYCFDMEIGGTLVNSGQFNGLTSQRVLERLIDAFPEDIKKTSTYHLRDWLISRQRYWGPPIPMIYCGPPAGGCGWQPVPEKDLPVELPFIEDYKPLGTGKAPLASHPEFYKTKCPKCGGDAKRETDVSDTFLDSAWYFLRYIATEWEDVPFPSKAFSEHSENSVNQSVRKSDASDNQKVRHADSSEFSGIAKRLRWLPVAMYIGGAEHSVLHLLYSRFITMALKDLGFINFEEPFAKFRAHGLIVKDGAKMSKSKGNVVVPDSYIKKFGADTLRAYLMFMGPFNQGGDFRDTGIEGMHRFLRRVWVLAQKSISNFLASRRSGQFPISNESNQIMHKTIKKVTEDIEGLNYNTAIAALMEWYNYLNEKLKVKSEKLTKEEIETFVKLLAPFAPHVSEELYQLLNDKKDFSSIHNSSWPKFDPKFLVASEMIIVVQVNGKLRGNLVVDLETSKNKAKIEALGRRDGNVVKHLEAKEIKKVIYIEGKVMNFVVV